MEYRQANESPRSDRRLLDAPAGVVIFTGAYMVGFGVWTTLQWNVEFVFYWVTMVALAGLLLMLHWRVRLPAPVLWGLSVWGLLHMAGGNVPLPEALGGVLYNLWIIPPHILRYDHVVHAYGFFVGAVAAWIGLRSVITLGRPPGIGVGVCVACLGMGLGAVNEVLEFVATLIVPETNVGGYRNTALDLVFNMVGAGAAAAGVVVWERKRFNGEERGASGSPGAS